MAALVTCLVGLRAEFNQLSPGRAKGADGWIGDVAHQARTSDHNPDSRGLVHAIDITTDLRCDLSLEQVVQFLLGRCRSGAEKRLRYIIFNRRIWRADNGWRQEVYTGTSDPHIGHAHFSSSHTPSLEASTASWHLEDLVALTPADIKAIWDYRGANPYDAKQVIAMSAFLRYAPSLSGIVNAIDAKLKARFDALEKGLDQADVDENAIAQAVLAGLSYQQIADAVVAALPPDQAQQVVNELSIRLSQTTS